MDVSGIPLVNQIFVVSGVLSTILSCGLSLGYIPSLQETSNNANQTFLDNGSLRYIETAGETAFISSIVIVPFTMQKKGRRMAAFVTTIPVLLSWLISFNARNFILLVIVHALHNISLGGAVSISSVIISEFCSPKYRGVFLMLETAMISLGVLLCHICSMLSATQVISSLGAITATVSLIVIYLWPESPYWLLSNGHLIKGTENFYWLRGRDDDAINEINNMLTKQKLKLQLRALKPIRRFPLREKILDYLKSLLKADFLKPLSIMVLIFSFIGLGGENLLTSYSLRNIFKLNGKYIGTIILDVLTLICSLIACILIRIVKRKTLFLFTSSCSIIFLGLISLFLFLQSLDWFVKDYLWLFLTLVTAFVMFMSLGTTALPFSLLGEIFPMTYKGVGSSLICAYFWAFSHSLFKLIPSLVASIGLPGLILLTSIMMIVVLTLLNKLMPDTDFKSLVEIEQLMKMHEEGHCEIDSNENLDIEHFDKLQLFIDV